MLLLLHLSLVEDFISPANKFIILKRINIIDHWKFPQLSCILNLIRDFQDPLFCNEKVNIQDFLQVFKGSGIGKTHVTHRLQLRHYYSPLHQPFVRIRVSQQPRWGRARNRRGSLPLLSRRHWELHYQIYLSNPRHLKRDVCRYNVVVVLVDIFTICKRKQTVFKMWPF